MNTTSLNKIFFVLHKNITKLLTKYPDNTYSDILSCLLLSYRGDTEFPQDEKLSSAISTEDFYGLRSWTRLFILCSIND
ncbi:MAG: hypothetical protein Q4F61_02860, partial [Candidatus Saccharibacteria bacterium]|nr:hypothetical protein [Candidatus Saccharibacteria bacterium]